MKKRMTQLLALTLALLFLAGCGPKDGAPDSRADTVTIRVEGFDSSVIPETQVEITEPFSLTEGGGADVEPEDYTALHALVTVLESAGVEYTVAGGFLSEIDCDIDSTEHGPWAGWMFSYNGASAESSAADIALSAGDSLIFYYCAFYDEMYHAYFEETAIAAETGKAVELKLTGANVTDFTGEDYGVYGPLADVTILVDGTKTEAVTDEKGQVSLQFKEAGTYVVTAYLPDVAGVNMLTYAPCTITVG